MDWRKQVAAFHGAENVYLIGGQNAGRTAMSLAMVKMYPSCRTVVPDLRTLDTLIKAGLKPSQIIVTSEFNDTSHFDAEVIRCHY